MSDKLCWQYDRGKTYDKSDIGTSILLANGKYRGWHCTAVINIGGNPFKHFSWHKAGLALYPGAMQRGSTVHLFMIMHLIV